MARAYSDDLRRKLLEAHDRGQGTLSHLAEQFGVSRGWAWKISSQRRLNGQIERKKYTPGAKSRLDRAELAALVSGQPDATLSELQAGLQHRCGLHFDTAYLWRVLRQMGIRLKKSHSTPQNATQKPTTNAGKSSFTRSVRSRATS